MFTGIVEAVAAVRSNANGRLSLDAPSIGEPWRLGESVAVSGVCLTVARLDQALEFDLSPETLARTTLGLFKARDPVNLERAMRLDGSFGGHIVQGHVDTIGEVVDVREDENSRLLQISVPDYGGRYLVDKGSVAVDGVSLTVVRPDGASFTAALIPHTLQATTLGRLKPGDQVNIEFDIMAKYAEKWSRQ